MMRASLGESQYWNGRVDRFKNEIAEDLKSVGEPSNNPEYAPQFWWDHCKFAFRLALLEYSRGDPIKRLDNPFPNILDAWERSNHEAEAICRAQELTSCRDWTFAISDLNHYNWCFWLVGLALAMEIPDEQWHRLLQLINGEGEDVLLDRIIASRQPGRRIGGKLLHKKPYARLLAAIDAPKSEQAVLLRDFVGHWYDELKRPAAKALWWYDYGDPEINPLEKGSYFGRWCLEAVAAVKAFGIDDSLCLGHEHYPGDLLRPDGPSTHPARKDAGKGWLAKLFTKA